MHLLEERIILVKDKVYILERLSQRCLGDFQVGTSSGYWTYRFQLWRRPGLKPESEDLLAYGWTKHHGMGLTTLMRSSARERWAEF